MSDALEHQADVFDVEFLAPGIGRPDLPSKAILADLRARTTAMHFRNVSQRLERTLPKLGSMRVQDLKAMHVIRLRAEEVAAGKSHRTANLVATTIQAMLRWAVENELISRSPIDRLKRLPESEEHLRCRRRAMSDDEIERFLAAAEADDAENALRWRYTRVPQVPLLASADRDRSALERAAADEVG